MESDKYKSSNKAYLVNLVEMQNNNAKEEEEEKKEKILDRLDLETWPNWID